MAEIEKMLKEDFRIIRIQDARCELGVVCLWFEQEAKDEMVLDPGHQGLQW